MDLRTTIPGRTSEFGLSGAPQRYISPPAAPVSPSDWGRSFLKLADQFGSHHGTQPKTGIWLNRCGRDRQHFSQRHFDRLRRAFLLVNSRGGVSAARAERIGEFNIVLQQTLPGVG